jgi:site-specific DNA recombinase
LLIYTLVEDGVTQVDDLLKDRITAIKADRDRVEAALGRAKAGVRPTEQISPVAVDRFGQLMREKLTTGEVSFRKAYLGSIVDRIEVDDREIRIVGRKDVLEQAVLAKGGRVPGVRSFVRKWRSLGESNPSFQIENLTS